MHKNLKLNEHENVGMADLTRHVGLFVGVANIPGRSCLLLYDRRPTLVANAVKRSILG